MERRLFDPLLYAWLGLAVVVFALLLAVSAPYGRHARAGWGPQINRTAGWVLMEAPAALGLALLFALGRHRTGAVAAVLLCLWELHYLNRAFVFPFRLRGGNRRMPLVIALFAVCFNLGNGYFNGRHLFELGPAYPDAWLLDGRFVAGALLFLGGWALNLHSDQILLRLRRGAAGAAADGSTGDGSTGDDYQIPRGGAFELVSCPNYLGELIEWSGCALATWSLPGLAFAVWTAANLVPRARAHHRWYRQRFTDYPSRRRAVIPFLF